jgi:hypothetical protein
MIELTPEAMKRTSTVLGFDCPQFLRSYPNFSTPENMNPAVELYALVCPFKYRDANSLMNNGTALQRDALMRARYTVVVTNGRGCVLIFSDVSPRGASHMLPVEKRVLFLNGPGTAGEEVPVPTQEFRGEEADASVGVFICSTKVDVFEEALRQGVVDLMIQPKRTFGANRDVVTFAASGRLEEVVARKGGLMMPLARIVRCQDPTKWCTLKFNNDPSSSARTTPSQMIDAGLAVCNKFAGSRAFFSAYTIRVELADALTPDIVNAIRAVAPTLITSVHTDVRLGNRDNTRPRDIPQVNNDLPPAPVEADRQRALYFRCHGGTVISDAVVTTLTTHLGMQVLKGAGLFLQHCHVVCRDDAQFQQFRNKTILGGLYIFLDLGSK